MNTLKLEFASSVLKHFGAMLLLVMAMAPMQRSWAGLSIVGNHYTFDCSDGVSGSQALTNESARTVTLLNCDTWSTTGTGVSPTGTNVPTNGAALDIVVSAGAVATVFALKQDSPSKATAVYFQFHEYTPRYIAADSSLVVRVDSVENDLTSLLHVSDPVSGQTETWTQHTAPSHGILRMNNAAAPSGSMDIAPPAGSVSYTPAPGYVGTDSFEVAVRDSTGGGTMRAIYVTVLAPEPPPRPLPTRYAPTPTVGIGSRPDVLNLGSGSGPDMVACLRETLGAALGANSEYLGQAADGSARMGVSGQYVSFYALDASSNSEGQGIVLGSTNKLTVLTACGTFITVPAIHNLSAFGAVLSGMGLSASINAEGVVTLAMDGRIHALRPDYLVGLGASGAPRLVKESDGWFRFYDGAGNVQVLRPAFLEPNVLNTQAASVIAFSSLRIQTDGTGLLTMLDGAQYVLTPDQSLDGVSADHSMDAWWRDASNHYTYRIYSFPSSSQGFSVTPRP